MRIGSKSFKAPRSITIWMREVIKVALVRFDSSPDYPDTSKSRKASQVDLLSIKQPVTVTLRGGVNGEANSQVAELVDARNSR